jgi:hypothetical protein
MDQIKNIGTMTLIENIDQLKYVPTGEGDVAPLLLGDKMTSHAMVIPPGFYPPHSHPLELLIICTKGSCDIFQGDGEVRGVMKPMSVAFVPANAEIGQEIHGPEPCQIVVVVAPRIRNREEFEARFSKD